MENIYYTPELEEFHCGFEFEEQDGDKWLKIICGVDDTADLEFYKDVILEKSVRVKYLDKEDVESLGFKHSNHNKSIFIYNKMISILPHLPKTTIGINFNDGLSHILIFNVPDENYFPAGVNLFVGSIKNKSELKRLLVQLGIN